MKKHFAPVVLFSLVAALWGCTSQELSYRMEDFSANNSGGDTLWGEAGARVSLRYPVFSSVSPTEADRANRVVDSLVFGAQGNADSLCAQFLPPVGTVSAMQRRKPLLPRFVKALLTSNRRRKAITSPRGIMPLRWR